MHLCLLNILQSALSEGNVADEGRFEIREKIKLHRNIKEKYIFVVVQRQRVLRRRVYHRTCPLNNVKLAFRIGLAVNKVLDQSRSM